MSQILTQLTNLSTPTNTPTNQQCNQCIFLSIIIQKFILCNFMRCPANTGETSIVEASQEVWLSSCGKHPSIVLSQLQLHLVKLGHLLIYLIVSYSLPSRRSGLCLTEIRSHCLPDHNYKRLSPEENHDLHSCSIHLCSDMT